MANEPVALMLALYQPDIPQNAGTLLRACACLGVAAALIEPAGFPVSDRNFRRAGLDYLDHVLLSRHASFAAFEAWRRTCVPARRLVLLTTAAATSYLDVRFEPGDILMVGRESAGVPPMSMRWPTCGSRSACDRRCAPSTSPWRPAWCWVRPFGNWIAVKPQAKGHDEFSCVRTFRRP